LKAIDMDNSKARVGSNGRCVRSQRKRTISRKGGMKLIGEEEGSERKKKDILIFRKDRGAELMCMSKDKSQTTDPYDGKGTLVVTSK